MKRAIVPVILSGAWISVSEFVRNQLLFLSYWENHYKQMHQTFATEPINGMVWGIWSFLFATVLYILLQKYSIRDTILLGWIVGFVMMWPVLGNLGVLPYALLWFAVPLSLIEVAVAIIIIDRIDNHRRKS